MRIFIFIFLLFLTACSSNSSNDSTNINQNCKDPQIKGNLTTYNGEKIYHVPGGQFYDVTKAEQMFRTEEEAQAAGYRRSER